MVAPYDNYSNVFFSYTFENIPQLKTERRSSIFYARMLPWQIMLKPNERALGVFLQCSIENESSAWYCKAKFMLRIKSHQANEKSFSRKFVTHTFSASESDFGYTNFITWEMLGDSKKAYIQNGAVTVEVFLNADSPCGLPAENIIQTPLELCNVLIPTARIHVKNGNVSIPVRATINSSSTTTSVASSIVRQNNLKTFDLDGKTYVKISIYPNKLSDIIYDVIALVTDKLPSKPYKKIINESVKDVFENLILADPNFTSDDDIDMELGIDVYSKCLKSSVIRYNDVSLVAQNTTLGWLIMGSY